MTAKKNKPVETDVDIKKNSELFLNKNYGKGVMKECIAHLENIKKSI